MGYWIKVPDQKNAYRCSVCSGTIQTALPLSDWTRCPYCHTDMIVTEEEAANGNSDADKNS